jgi:transcription elongation factor GreA
MSGDNYTRHFPSNKKVFLTKNGLDRLKDQLNHLSKERTSMCKRLLNMDSREREEYIESTDALRFLEKNETEIIKISDILMNAEVVVRNKARSDIGLGSTVSIEYMDSTKRYTIVDPIEANPSKHMISRESPLGKALLGKKKLSNVSLFGRDGRRYRYRVLDVA